MQIIHLRKPGAHLADLTADPEAYFRTLRVKAADTRKRVARRRFLGLLR